jgi:hypothetical protein
MLKIGELCEEVADVDKNMEVVVQNYDGSLHTIIADSIQFDYTGSRIILELFNEIEGDDE